MKRFAAWALVVFVLTSLFLAHDTADAFVRPLATPRGAATARPEAGITLDTIPGLVARWAADTLALSNNDPVVNWVDATNGIKTFTQSTANLRPTYKTSIFASGKPAVSCDNDVGGQNDILQIVAQPSTASAGALYFVAVPRDSSLTAAWFGAAIDGSNILRVPHGYDSGDGFWKQAVRSTIGNLGAIGYTTASGTLVVDTPVIVRVASSGSAWFIRINGTEMAMSSLGSRGGNNGEWFDDQVFTAYSLCGVAYPTNNFSLQADVDIGEFIIVDGAQWSTNDDTVFNLLNTKYTVY